MARIVLLSATPADDETPYNREPVRALRESARVDRFREHVVIDDSNSADLIIFAEYYGGGFHFERLRAHPLVRRFREKCFLFCSNAFVVPFLPGIYASLEKRWGSARTSGGFYLGVAENEFTHYTPPGHNQPYLFSFVGCVTNAPVRRQLAQLSHPRAFFRDTAETYARLLRHQMSPDERREYHRAYAEATTASKFVLCPRGLGASTIRLFETMRMGRVPVILSDDWLPFEGPRWEEFSIRIPESAVAELPRLLENREAEAVEMGERAHAAWQDWFAAEVAFHRIVESCLAIQARRRIPESIARWPQYLHYLRSFHGRRLLRRKLDGIRNRSGAVVSGASLAGSGV